MPSAPCLDGAAALSPVAVGMWQSVGRAFSWSWSPNFSQEHSYGSPEQVLRLLKPSKNPIKVFPRSGSYQYPCTAKWFSPEAQAVQAEILHLSEAAQTAGVHSGAYQGHHIEASHTDQAPRGLHMPIQQLEGHHCGGGSSSSHVAPNNAGYVHAGHNAVSGNASVWNGSSLGRQGVYAGMEKPFEPPFHAGDSVMDQNYSASLSQSSSFLEVEAFQSSNVFSGVSNDVRATNDCKNTMHSYIGNQLVGIKDNPMSSDHVGDGSTSYNQGARAERFYTDGQMSGSMRGTSGTLSDVDKHFEDGIGSEEALSPRMVAMDNSEATSESCKVAALRVPTYRTPMYLQDSPRDSVCYLASLGVDCDKIFQFEPLVKSCTLKQIKAMVSALEGYGVNCKDSGRIFNLCPKVLLLDAEKDLKIATSFLFYEAGLLPKDFGKVIRRCPRLLLMGVDTHLRPTLSFLRSLGFGKMGHAIANNPSLLSYNVKSKLLPRMRLLESWGFAYREAAAMVVRFPAIFNYSAVENLQCKYDYLIHEIKAGKRDLLAFPQYFGYSLESRIRPRHQRLAKLNVSLSIQAMLTLSDWEFNTKFSIVGGASTVRRKDEISDLLYEYESIEAKLQL
ncbi:hypothetical protein L7F22_040170 [Adiantum nelumboides]|nr:hypothetical protein [Adiantum nelumboides]